MTTLLRTVANRQTASSQSPIETPCPPTSSPLRPGSRAEDVLLRGLDVVLSAALLLVSLPLSALIALAIRLDDGGPVLFRQTRVGRGGSEFSLLKFRSMAPDAEARRLTLGVMNERTGPVFKIRRDPRITRVGRLLRRWSLDELPQLFNVLRGDMSLVGPRPALPSEVARYSDLQRERLSVPPGLTGLWQVSGRASLSFERSVELDLFYVHHRSLALNLRLLARTLPAVLSGRGAY